MKRIKKRLRKIAEIKSVMFCNKYKTLTIYLKEKINPIVGEMVAIGILNDNLEEMEEFWWYGGRYLKILDKNFKISETYENRIVFKECDFGEWR